MNGVILCGASLEFFMEELPKLPGNYLEIGVYDGRLVRTLAEMFPEKKFFGVDPFIEDGYTTGHNGVPVGQPLVQQRENAHRNLDSLDNVVLVESTSIRFYDYVSERLKVNPSDGDISAVLIDGSHHYVDVNNDFRLAIKLLHTGGIIYADDLDVPDVERACVEFLQREFKRIAKWEWNKFWIKPA